MVSSSEKRRLLNAYREPIDARAAVAKSVAGLLVIAVIALIGASYPGEVVPTANLSTARAASGR